MLYLSLVNYRYMKNVLLIGGVVVLGVVGFLVLQNSGTQKAVMEQKALMEQKAMMEKKAMEDNAMMEQDAMKKDDSMMKTNDASMKKDDTMMKGDEAMKSGETMKKDDSMMKQEADTMVKTAPTTMMQKGSYELYDASKLALADKGDVVLFFKASWCPSCKAVDADIKANRASIKDGLTILEVDYDNSTALKTKYGVTYQHTFVQVDSKGNMIAKWSGSPTLVALTSNVK